MRICVAGGGAFGTALAVALSGEGPVDLYVRDPDAVRRMREGRDSPRLPGVSLPATVVPDSDPDCLRRAGIVLLAIPAQKLRGFLAEHRDRLAGKPLVACAKGIDLATLRGPTATIAEGVPDAVPAILSGPSFAADIARGLPTALVLACADERAGAALQAALSRGALRLYRSTDVAGVELGGALKNVIAIACGAAIGGGLGESARAALMTRGFAEMSRLARALGARTETLSGLSGLGDLALTCGSDLSRNFRHGQAIGRGDDAGTAETVEGASTARPALELAVAHGIDMPVTQVVADLVAGEIDLTGALHRLLDRPLKEE
ncbi:NAD(P)H-dependent glycerol-3-phosphate dehydrogenase [Wenxinia saemankumensis]|uniref:Glycerol-3-phosphate dehydrogenase [NAD(P)+] n=1 Tax=Wenxinia saemankumensis TaxID=1447782 RepID=A0A1M6G462_9RHOB|nr:NAD(P)H-dependent glycerol-3-phosphate dehydrogenase [Wenxinia saemankumensis]SHJ04642.1 glycerol-3-phosphate dehydrogenase (NAD(P)+) [Wenxinia saemankumensis]